MARALLRDLLFPLCILAILGGFFYYLMVTSDAPQYALANCGLALGLGGVALIVGSVTIGRQLSSRP